MNVEREQSIRSDRESCMCTDEQHYLPVAIGIRYLYRFPIQFSALNRDNFTADLSDSGDPASTITLREHFQSDAYTYTF